MSGEARRAPCWTRAFRGAIGQGIGFGRSGERVLRTRRAVEAGASKGERPFSDVKIGVPGKVDGVWHGRYGQTAPLVEQELDFSGRDQA